MKGIYLLENLKPFKKQKHAIKKFIHFTLFYPNIFKFIISFLELFRRCIWNILRVENY